MKHKIIISLTIIAVSFIWTSYVFQSCSGGHQPSDEIKDDGELDQMERYNLKTYVLDSCEYIGRLTNARTDVLSHKGNCRFCKEREEVKHDSTYFNHGTIHGLPGTNIYTRKLSKFTEQDSIRFEQHRRMRQGHVEPGNLKVYKSDDGGVSWDSVNRIFQYRDMYVTPVITDSTLSYGNVPYTPIFISEDMFPFHFFPYQIILSKAGSIVTHIK